MRKKRLLALGLVVMFTLGTVLTGCGSSPSSSKEKSDDIVIKVGVKTADVPYSQQDENGNLTGVEEDMVTAAFKKIDGYTVEFVGFADSPTLLAALEAGSIDVASGRYGKTEERTQKFKFPDQGVQADGTFILSRKENSYQTYKDLAGMTLDFNSTTIQRNYVENWNAANPNYQININITNESVSSADLYQQVITGQRKAILSTKGTWNQMAKNLDVSALTLSDKPVNTASEYQLFNKSIDDNLINKYSDALKAIKEDGTVVNIYRKWTGNDISEFLNN